MYYDVIEVTPQEDYTLLVACQDGKKGIFDMKPYLDFGVFKALKDKSYFKQVFVLFGAVSWPDGQDIAPEMLYESLLFLSPPFIKGEKYHGIC